MKEYEVDAYLSIKDEESFDRELRFEEGEDYKVTRVVDDGSNTGSGVYVIDGRGAEVFVDLMDLTVSESRDFGVLRTELFCVDKLVKGDKVLILQMSKMEEGEQFNVGEVAEVSLVGSDGTVYLESRYEEFVPVRNYERGYITKVKEITEKKEVREDMLKVFEAGDIIKVLEPDRVIAGYDLTKGREYTVINEYGEEGCYILDDEGDSLYLTKYEIEAHCEVTKREEVNTKEKRGSMLKVNVIKDKTKTVEDKWKAGNILSNKNGSTVIMLVKPNYTDDERLEALVLKYDFSTYREYSIDKSSKSHWLEECPILVNKSELSIEI